MALGKGCPACRATIVDFSTSDTFGRAGIYDSNSKEQQRASKDRLAREFLRYRLWDPRHDTSAHAAPPFWHGKVSRKVLHGGGGRRERERERERNFEGG